jgi:hypothetical protein
MTKRKQYVYKLTPALIKRLKPYWVTFCLIEDEYWESVGELEKKMTKELKIPDIEIFHSDGGAVGIGNVPRTMELIQREELEGNNT